MNHSKPLAERMRPQSLGEYIGQQHLLAPDAVLRKAIESGRLPSIILWGPPGVGKTTLAQIISHQLDRPFYTLSAINSGVKDIREIIEKAKKAQFFDTNNPILFIDEIHRFSKSQQDSLLAAVEQGIVTLIGATTENPSFEVISPLLSRCQVYVLQSLEADDLRTLIARALAHDVVLKQYKVTIKQDEALLRFSSGDARKLYNVLDIVIHAQNTDSKIVITNDLVTKSLQENIALYDKDGEQHYDVISAFIKSIRGSDPNAAVYWLARMLEGGEDIRFIARRMIISASEDVGLANPNALLLAQSCFDAVHVLGMPEARIILSQTAVYLATSQKSNSTYLAIDTALQLVKQTGNIPVPLHLRNAPTKLMKQLDYGKGYKYSHDYSDNFVSQDFLPEELNVKSFWRAGTNQKEQEIQKRMQSLWKSKYEF